MDLYRLAHDTHTQERQDAGAASSSLAGMQTEQLSGIGPAVPGRRRIRWRHPQPGPLQGSARWPCHLAALQHRRPAAHASPAARRPVAFTSTRSAMYVLSPMP